MILITSPRRILVRLVLKWKFVEIISTFCATLSAIGGNFLECCPFNWNIFSPNFYISPNMWQVHNSWEYNIILTNTPKIDWNWKDSHQQPTTSSLPLQEQPTTSSIPSQEKRIRFWLVEPFKPFLLSQHAHNSLFIRCDHEACILTYRFLNMKWCAIVVVITIPWQNALFMSRRPYVSFGQFHCSHCIALAIFCIIHSLYLIAIWFLQAIWLPQ